MRRKRSTDRVSVRRVRIGVALVVLWWLPFYLLGPALADLVGKGDDPSARRAATLLIVVVQTGIGLLGGFLAGRELVATLGKVRRRRMLPVAWRIVWSGNTDVRATDLKDGSSPGDDAPALTAEHGGPVAAPDRRPPP